MPWEEAYRNHWRIRISDQKPPETDIVVVGTESKGDSPIHDRWWVTENSGIRMGTSFNTLGIGKTSDISILSREESSSREVEIDRCLQRIEREYKEERLLYTLFTL
jgi:hypothetical protein